MKTPTFSKARFLKGCHSLKALIEEVYVGAIETICHFEKKYLHTYVI